MRHTLTAEERKIATVLQCGLNGRGVSRTLVFWATKLASIVDPNDARTPSLSAVLRDCLFHEATARALLQPDPHCPPGRLEAQKAVQRCYMKWATNSAYRAAEIAASIKGVRIDTRTLVPLGTYAPHSVLEAAYDVLAANGEHPGL